MYVFINLTWGQELSGKGKFTKRENAEKWLEAQGCIQEEILLYGRKVTAWVATRDIRCQRTRSPFPVCLRGHKLVLVKIGSLPKEILELPKTPPSQQAPD